MSLYLPAQIIGAGPPLIILHGLFGASRNWSSVARKLADIRESHALDMRNHGNAPWAETMDYPSMAEDVAAYMARQRLRSADILGHSMGGKTAMALALERPWMVNRLIVVDIAPRAYRENDNFAYARAMRAVRLEGAARRGDVEEQLVAGVPDARLRAFLMQNLQGEPGAYHWRVNLPVIEATLPDLRDFPELRRAFEGPATFIIGKESKYVTEKGRDAIARYFPKAKLVEMEGVGHWPHADQPDRFVALVREALA